MASHANYDFLQCLNAERGSKSQAVGAVQEFLERFGYMQKHAIGAFKQGMFDDGTAAAVRRYQQFQGLAVTGKLDDATLGEMSKPRCGCRDVGDLADFEVDGRKWSNLKLSYHFSNQTPDIPKSEQQAALEEAFKLWSDVCALSFSAAKSGADIEILFASGEHGDGSSFDGPGRVLAHAFFPPPNGGNFAGDAHFDESETWGNNLPVPDGRFDLLTVAAHEFGHSIGLAHSNVRGALMFPSYSGPHRFLHQDDIAGAQALYGPPGDPSC